MRRNELNELLDVIQEFGDIVEEIKEVLSTRAQLLIMGKDSEASFVSRESAKRMVEILQPYFQGVDLDVSINILNLPLTVLNPLKERKVFTVREVIERGPEEILKMRNMGTRKIEILEEQLVAYCRIENPWRLV